MMGIFGKRLAGAGYVVLNVVRAMNIISLLAVIAASSVMLVKTFNNNSFFFFGAVEHVMRVVICGFLILTELPLFKNYFSRNWPLFSTQSGFVMLGLVMLLVGNSTLANLNSEEASQENLGITFWRLVIGSGIVIFVMGVVNIAASYIFRSKHLNLTARHVRSSGATAPHKLEVESTIAASTPRQKQSRRSKYKSLFLPNKHRDSLPSYNSQIARSDTGMTQTSHHVVASPYGMNSPGKNDPFTTTSHANMPVSPSSKYSVESSRVINRPNLAHHPAHMPRGNYI